MWKMKATVVPVVNVTLKSMTPRLEEMLHQTPGTTSEVSVQKDTVLGPAKIKHMTLKLQGLW